MNATVRDSTAELVERHARARARGVGAIFAGEADKPEVANNPIKNVFDFSLLKFKEKDELMECFRSWSRKVPFDMEMARDRRQRKYYDDRFDHRKNVLDWDYHMRILPQGAGVIHFKHFAQWRLAGRAAATPGVCQIGHMDHHTSGCHQCVWFHQLNRVSTAK
jgi:dynein assembly factor 3